MADTGLSYDDVDAIPGARVLVPEIVSVRYVPVPLARERLEAAGQWDALVTVLSADMPKLVKLLTLRDGLNPADPEVLAVLDAIGADADAILAP
jgi:hypothetical protein